MVTEKNCLWCLSLLPVDQFSMNGHGEKRNKCRSCCCTYLKLWKLRKKMNQQRFNSIYENLSAVTKRVYDSVPKLEPWDVNKIIRENQRLSGAVMQQSAASNAINTLVSNGLIVESKRGFYMRTKVLLKETPETKPAKTKGNMKTTDKSPLHTLVMIAESLTGLVSQINVIKRDLENAAMDIEEKHNKTAEDFEQLRHFQALMKGVKG